MRHLHILRPWWRHRGASSDNGVRDLWRGNQQILRDHFGVIAGVLLLFCGMIWAVGEHARQRAELRIAETDRHIAAFHSGPVGDAWGRLTRVWHAESHRQNVLLDRMEPLSGPALKAALRNYRAFVIDTVEENQLGADITTVIQFYGRLATCVRIGNCDASRTAGMFGGEAWSFRNQHYYYLQEERAVDDVDRVIKAIAPSMVPPQGSP